MRLETTRAVCPEATPPRNDQPKPLCFTRWSRIQLDLPDAPEHILDDIFWSAVAYEDHKPETQQYLEEHGFRGVMWP